MYMYVFIFYLSLQKGSGYHLDMFIVACLVGCFSCFGLPWVVGATVRSIAHVQSLFLYSPSSAPGERPKFLGVKEQRITLLSMAVLLGVSILLYQVLKVSLNSVSCILHVRGILVSILSSYHWLFFMVSSSTLELRPYLECK